MPSLTLFGSWDSPWRSEAWEAKDDRIRGGRSKSHLVAVERSDHTTFANFYGHLDIKTLGGAGFASQANSIAWDLQAFDGLSITLMPTAPRPCTVFTLNIKTDLPVKRPDGRNESTVVYEFDFDASETMQSTSDINPQAQGAISTEVPNEKDLEKAALPYGKVRTIRALWKDFVPTYRGRPVPKEDAKKLDPSQIKEISIMCRSNFGKQSGDFNLFIADITAFKDQSNLLRRVGTSAVAFWSWLTKWFLGIFGSRTGGRGFIRL